MLGNKKRPFYLIVAVLCAMLGATRSLADMDRLARDCVLEISSRVFASLPPDVGPRALPSSPRRRLSVAKVRDMLWDKVMSAVLREGERLYLKTTNWEYLSNGQIRITSGPKSRPFGTYHVTLVDDPAEIYPIYGTPELLIGPSWVYGEMRVLSDPDRWNIPQLQGFFRELIRADSYLHAPRYHPDWPLTKGSIATWLQERALGGLYQLEETENPAAHGFRALSMGPSAGKTTTSTQYVRGIGGIINEGAWLNPVNVIFCLQSEEGLDRVAQTYQRDLNLDEAQVMKIYAKHLKTNDPSNINEAIRLALISRSSYENKRAALHEWIRRNPNQAFVIVFDEAQFLGKLPGEYYRILEDLKQLMAEPGIGDRVRVLLLSGTLWHRHRNIVREILGGNIVVPLLNETEMADFRAGKKLVELSRAEKYREINMGYSVGPTSISFIPDDGNGVTSYQHLMDPGYNDRTKKYRAQPLADLIAQEILATRHPNVPDRGIAFCRDIEQAGHWYTMLSKIPDTEVRLFHSGVADRDEVWEWLTDTRSRAHRIAFGVKLPIRALDFGGLNLFLPLRMYGDNSGGVSEFMQCDGRFGRAWDLKDGYRIIDPSGASTNLFDGLSHIMPEPNPNLENYTGRRGGSRRPAEGVVRVVSTNGIKELPPQRAVEVRQLFPANEMGAGTFLARHPYYDHNVFSTQSLPILWDLAKSLGIAVTKGEHKIRELLLRLADGVLDEDKKAEFLTAIHDPQRFESLPTDGMMVFQSHNYQACQRFFQALHDLASMLQATPEGIHLDLMHLHEPQNIQALTELLFPERKSLLDPSAIAAYLDPQQGSFALITEEMGYQNYDNIGAKRHIIKFFTDGLREVPDCPFRSRLDTELRYRWDWNDSDLSLAYVTSRFEIPTGEITQEQRLKLGRRSFQHSYRALYALAIAARDLLELDIDPKRIHLRTEAEKLFRALYPRVLRLKLSDHELDAFRMGPVRGFEPVSELHALLEVPDLSRNYGSREAAIQIIVLTEAKSAELAAEKEKLLETLRDPNYGFEPGDARSLGGEARLRARINYRAYLAAAEFYRKATGDTTFDPRSIRYAGGMRYLIDMVTVKIPIPDLGANWSEFVHPTKGGNLRLDEEAKRIGYRSWQRDYAARGTILHLMRSPKLKDILPSHLFDYVDSDLWEWRTDDGHSAKDNFSAAQRLYRALYLVAYYARTVEGGETIDLKSIHLRREVDKLVKLLYPEVLVRWSPDQIVELLSEGGIRAVTERQSLLGITRITDGHGLRNFMVGLLAQTDVGQNQELRRKKRDLKKRLESEEFGWTPNDAKEVKEKNVLACRRHEEAITAIFSLYNETTTENQIDMTQSLTFRGQGAGIDTILFGFAIPEPTDEQWIAFADEGGSLLEVREQFFSAGRSNWNDDWGPRRFFVELLKRPGANVTPAKKVLTYLESDDLWGWKASDGLMARDGRPGNSAHRRIYRAMYVRNFLASLELPEVRMEPRKSHLRIQQRRLYREMHADLAD